MHAHAHIRAGMRATQHTPQRTKRQRQPQEDNNNDAWNSGCQERREDPPEVKETNTPHKPPKLWKICLIKIYRGILQYTHILGSNAYQSFMSDLGHEKSNFTDRMLCEFFAAFCRRKLPIKNKKKIPKAPKRHPPCDYTVHSRRLQSLWSIQN